MKKIIFVLLIIGLMISSGIIKAQNPSGFTFKAGMNFDKYKAKSIVDLDYKSISSYHLGTYYSFQVKQARIQTGLTFVRRGGEEIVSKDIELNYNNETAYTYVEETSTKIYLNYLEIPLNLSFKLINFSDKGDGINLFMEPALGFCLYGEMKSGENDSDIEIGSEDTDDIKPLNISFKFGASIKLKHLEPYVGYDMGLTDITPQAGTIKNSGFYFGIAYNLF
ncbi:porin family protein [Prolixibacteraceae bacterium]|nr:porin family protein [Prolixibacteraceae bacterium]